MDTTRNTIIIFSLNGELGSLAKALEIFQNNSVNLLRIESRYSTKFPGEYEFIVECDGNSGDIENTVEMLNGYCSSVQVIKPSGEEAQKKQEVEEESDNATPWFPRTVGELNEIANKVRSCGAELDEDTPGHDDLIYRKRRQQLANIAYNYNAGENVPRVEYTAEEIDTWGKIFRRLTKLYPTHACKEYLRVLPLLIENCGYREDNIPQLQDVSDFLKQRTGFTVRPASGLLSARDFFASLAFRIYHATQYVRHHSSPYYTPEPDVCHEMLGHAPLLADPAFANFSQEIGLASLGASDEVIDKLATCYWFTGEFGLCRQDGEIKAYGAGLLSSYGELQNSQSGQPELRAFEPEKTCLQEYPLNGYQPVYYVAESFEDAKIKLRKFAAAANPRPYSLRYNPYTCSVEIIRKVSRPHHDKVLESRASFEIICEE